MVIVCFSLLKTTVKSYIAKKSTDDRTLIKNSDLLTFVSPPTLLPDSSSLPFSQTYRRTRLQYSEYSWLNTFCIFFSSERTIAWCTATTNAPSRITTGFTV